MNPINAAWLVLKAQKKPYPKGSSPEERAHDKLMESMAPTTPPPKKVRVGSPGQEIPLRSTIPADSPLFYGQGNTPPQQTEVE